MGLSVTAKLTAQQPDLVFDRKIDEVSIHYDLVWRSQLAVVFEKEGCGRFLTAAAAAAFHQCVGDIHDMGWN